ncbi:MAG: calcium/sodium antiporter [Gammaproteobacteria bacterium]|nr:calcium/sodium antiporter [Gammaproteobacteria bacterium]MDH3970820.1 calcium/sodium antiporter [Gammaproteobacteria bacterium]
MWMESLAIVAGFALLTWSADRFVAGASALAYNLSVSPLVIGLTIVSLGTSAPEILVSAVASLQGNGGLAIGNALGSNIANIALILGITALVVPLGVHSRIVRRELPVLIGVMLLVLLLLLDGTLGRLDGVILLSGMVLMLIWMARVGIREKSSHDPVSDEFADEVPTDMSMRTAGLWTVVGALSLLASSKILVWGAVSVAHSLGVSDLVIGLTIVALGTSLPELAACIMSALKNEPDIAIGNIVGSNIFNLLAVLALPGLISPIAVADEVLMRDYPVMACLTLAFLVMAYGFRGPGRISRIEGALLVLAFVGYQTLLYFSEVA